MNITQLIEIVNKVYMKREVQTEREAEKRMKRKVSLLAVALKDDQKVERNRQPREGEASNPSSTGSVHLLQRKGALEK